jgi:hypothetical protein
MSHGDHCDAVACQVMPRAPGRGVAPVLPSGQWRLERIGHGAPQTGSRAPTQSQDPLRPTCICMQASQHASSMQAPMTCHNRTSLDKRLLAFHKSGIRARRDGALVFLKAGEWESNALLGTFPHAMCFSCKGIPSGNCPFCTLQFLPTTTTLNSPRIFGAGIHFPQGNCTKCCTC